MSAAACSVVIVSAHSASPYYGQMLVATLLRVLAQEGLAEVLFMDGGHAPDVTSRIQQMALSYEKLRLISVSQAAGYAQACNIAARQAAGDYLLLLQAGCLLPPGALAAMMSHLAKTPQAAAATCWLQNTDGSEYVREHPQLLTPKRAFFYHARLGRKLRAASFVPTVAFPMPAAGRSVFCMSVHDYERFSGLDEQYVKTGELLDLSRRIQLSGRQVHCLPDVRATRLTGPERAPSFVRLKGLVRYYHRNFSGIVPLPWLWGLDAMLVVHWAACRARTALRRALKGWRFAWVSPTAAEEAVACLVGGLVDMPEGVALEGRQVVLTGAASPVGLSVLKRLLAQGAQVLAVVRHAPPPYAHERLEWLQADLAAPLKLPEGEWDTLIHCAPLWHLPPHLPALAQAGCRRVMMLGTTVLFTRAGSGNWHEKSLSDKLAKAEEDTTALAKKHAISCTIMRPTLMYGVSWRGSLGRVMRFILRFGFLPYYPPAQGKRHPVHVDDVAHAMMLALDVPQTHGKAYNISGGEVVVMKEVLVRCFHACGRKPQLLRLSLLPFILDVVGRVLHKHELNAEMAYRMNDDLMYFHDAARADFGFSPRPFQPQMIRAEW